MEHVARAKRRIRRAILRFLPLTRERTRSSGAASRDQAGRERGVAILIVVLMTLIVSALGATAVVMSNTNHLIAANERDSERALFASKAGLEYGYYLYARGVMGAGATSAAFDSFDPAVRGPLDGASFTGAISYVSNSRSLGQVYRIQSTGRFNRASRTTEVVLQVVSESLRYGFVGYNEVELHNHSHVSGSAFRLDSAVFCNGSVEIQQDMTLDGTVVSAGDVILRDRGVVNGDLFVNSLATYGEIRGDVRTVAAVDILPDDVGRYDRVDAQGKKYAWYNGNDSAGGIIGGGRILGTRSSYTVHNGDEFRSSIFRSDGKPLPDPDLNVVRYVPPPGLNYAAMKSEAERYEPTYFTTMSAAMSYLAGKKVVETIGGKTVTTIRVGTDTFPEFLYVVGSFNLRLDPTAPADDPARGILKADGFHLEGGLYASDGVTLNGPAFDPMLHPAPPDWYQFRINALPYCLPAIVGYRQPPAGSVDSWTPEDTPVMSSTGAQIEISSAHSLDHEGFVLVNGLTLSQGETHLHHTQAAEELIRFNGAELAYKIHSCDFMSFTYDPEVRCTSFVENEDPGGSGTARVVSYREIR